MTEYDLRTRRALRQVTLLEFGFGPETMRRCKLCPECGRANPAQDTHCADCGAVLPEKTLYDFYLSRHRCCQRSDGLHHRPPHGLIGKENNNERKRFCFQIPG